MGAKQDRPGWRVHLYFSAEMYKEIQEYAQAERRSISAEVARAWEVYVEQIRAKNDPLKAWREQQAKRNRNTQ